MKRLLAIFILICYIIPLSPAKAFEPSDQQNELHVHFIDVGQADCILIQTPQHKNILIDSGSAKTQKKVIRYFHALNIEGFDAIIATHPHHDHIGAMAAIMENFHVKAFYMPDVTHYTRAFKALHHSVKKQGVMVFKAKAGNKIDVEPGVAINIIAPLKGNYDNLNDYSFVLKLVHEKNTFLFMADAGEQSETELLEKDINVKADVIKIGHHGGVSSTTLPFLKRVNPEAAVITSAQRSMFGFPSHAVIQRLRYLRIPTYRTDIHGTIIAHSDGQRIIFSFGGPNAQDRTPIKKSKKRINEKNPNR
ncbi:metallo beta-lactamase superfamily lipoprotein [Pullulanibacillus camelliae]|uniref:Metallo beta-lactamase superfamily lipoprotein n=1 Tax=Pullulanibacillus camelliae TaxID=1707096 RepID=A0A8J2YHS4_9BACL|nr:MBL fold metallo-hydrolase [Pullulanibacillus camelliae]GGE43753.1 metallo beta-lactamase superfamily lipoprotein [Pullulanibacillus camelliae]